MSWIVLLYPALSLMRVLARGVSHIVDAESKSNVRLAATKSDVILSGLARDVTSARIDLVHFPIVYYFVSNDPTASVAMWVRELIRFADDAGRPECPDRMRFAAGTLDKALDEFATILDQRFLDTGSRDRMVIFNAFAADHMIDG